MLARLGLNEVAALSTVYWRRLESEISLVRSLENMWMIGGALTAGVTTLLVWRLTEAGFGNAEWTPTVVCVYLVVVMAALSSFLAASAIFRRAGQTREHLCVFAGLSGGVAGGLIGAAYAVGLTVAYVASYTTWPDDRLDQVLILLAYPAFGAGGFCVGAAAGLVLGLVAGSLLWMAPIRRRLEHVF